MIITRETIYEVDGLTMVAHLAHPKGEGPWPTILIGHDGVGLDDYQRQRANELAENGYLAYAMEYHGGALYFGRPKDMLARIMPLMADDERMQSIGHAALNTLLAIPGCDLNRLGCLGYGAGGRILLELVKTGISFKAVAVIHPALPEVKAEDLPKSNTTFLLCTGSEDPICTPELVMKFSGVLQETGFDWNVNIYGGAKHAFWAKPQNTVDGINHDEDTVPGVGYHSKHEKRAWRDVLSLFNEIL